MYNAGRPDNFPDELGTAYFAYDCVTDIFCVAAHLNNGYIGDCEVVEGSNSWVSISGRPGKYDASNAFVFKYVVHPNSKTIGKLMMTWQHHDVWHLDMNPYINV